MIENAISFEGRVAVVTGAGRGLGRAYALELARRGAAVVVNDADTGGRADVVVAEIRDCGGKATASRDDVTTPEGGRAVIDAALESFGGIHVIINNAGFLRPALFEDMSWRAIREVIDVHLMGAMHVTQPAWPIFKDQGYGRVVMTSSSAIFGNESSANYAAAKAGLLGLAAALASEGNRHGIKVNSVLPYAKTLITADNPLVGSDTSKNRSGLMAMGARLTPESVAALTIYLASDSCAVNGQAFSALAGRYARVFLGLTQGWLSDRVGEVTAEDIGERLPEISRRAGYFAPRSMGDEITEVRSRLESLAASAMSSTVRPSQLEDRG